MPTASGGPKLFLVQVPTGLDVPLRQSSNEIERDPILTDRRPKRRAANAAREKFQALSESENDECSSDVVPNGSGGFVVRDSDDGDDVVHGGLFQRWRGERLATSNAPSNLSHDGRLDPARSPDRAELVQRLMSDVNADMSLSNSSSSSSDMSEHEVTVIKHHPSPGMT
ncbi:Hypp8118 [Branchiostoma lanceolatum]|uniref:Hypp8118 protein n=1 Tax=Branchiostoma lanceolatum TaxID=7740 RepID=A0A8J9Z663_BRALA|nr:Hypp8118 [Branchiostoma lanceolatum]